MNPIVTFAITSTILLSACRAPEPQRASFTRLPNVVSKYGRLITVANHPTADQHGTGERIGFFLTKDGTIWGLPLAVNSASELLVCVVPELSNFPVTDTIPRDAEIIGATNEPTGWRGGTGQLELVLRSASGKIGSFPVKSRETTGAAACWAEESPGPRQRLHYYRISRSD